MTSKPTKRGQHDPERIARLRTEAERVNAELHAVEDGTLPWMETYPMGCFIAKTFAEAFGLTEQAAHNRLRKLVDVGLVERVKHPGRSSSYMAIKWDLGPLVVDGEAGERLAEVLRRRGVAT